MVGRTALFPLNTSGLLFGVFSTALIAMTGAYTRTLWPLSGIGLTTVRTVGWTLAALLFITFLHRVRSGASVSLRLVMLSSVLLCAPFFLTQPIFAGDLYAYVAGARVGAIGNPYVVTPGALGTATILNGVAPAWRNQPSAYGPLWSMASTHLGILVPSDIALFTLFRCLALAGVLACAWLIARASSPLHAGLIALNPIVLVDAVADGHHDILIGLAVLAAVLWLRRPARSAFALAVAAALKFVPLVVAPVLIASAPAEKRRALGAWLSLSFVGLFIVCFAPFWIGPHTFDGLRQQAGLFAHPMFFPQFIVFLFAYLGGSVVHPEVIARSFGLLTFFLVYGWVFRAAWLQRLTPVAATAIALAAYIFFAAPYVQTWYLLWLLPVLALLPTRQAVRLTGVVSVVWGAMLVSSFLLSQ